jgi:hypothetical protein
VNSAPRRLGQSLLSLGLTVVIAGCGQAEESPTASQPTITSNIASTTASPSTTSDTGATTTIQNILDLPHFTPLEATTYYIDPDDDPSTPLRVLYTVPNEGWLQWIGTFKPEDISDAEGRFVGVSITAVTNLMVDACLEHRPADPAIGPTVDDLADGLAQLPPFVLKEPPTEVTIYGYMGKYLELAVPDDISFEIRAGGGYFTDCGRGELQSWLAPGLSYVFYGYAGPGQIEELWILDVDGNRLMIQATWFPDSPPQDIAEMRTILDSIRIEP